MKNNLKGIVMIVALGFFIQSKVYPDNSEDASFLTPKCYNTALDYNLRVRKDSDDRWVLDYFVCVNSKYKIKDVEYYIDGVPVWSISIDRPPLFGMVKDATFSHGIILESIKDFKKGVHEAKVIFYNENNIESKIRNFKLGEDIKLKPYGPY